MHSEDIDAIVQRALDGARRDWIEKVRFLADQCEAYAPSVGARGDAALHSSMEFVALRLRKVADREETERD